MAERGTGRAETMLMTPLTRGSTTKLRPVIAATAGTTASMSALTKFKVTASSAARSGAASTSKATNNARSRRIFMEIWHRRALPRQGAMIAWGVVAPGASASEKAVEKRIRSCPLRHPSTMKPFGEIPMHLTTLVRGRPALAVRAGLLALAATLWLAAASAPAADPPEKAAHGATIKITQDPPSVQFEAHTADNADAKGDKDAKSDKD